MKKSEVKSESYPVDLMEFHSFVGLVGGDDDVDGWSLGWFVRMR